ncbi:MAG: tetratricopeptide repeat protein, partial [Gammaproteobacteria bacterium]
LVVHRDLKPSNVLVDRDGRARLLDFGIAKLLDPGAADGAPLTRVGHVVMTPEYAAPEQHSGGEVTTATDVFQLGLLLHELLTGSRPAAHTGRPTGSASGSASGSTVARPSRLVRHGPAAAAGPPLAPPALARRLRGDLDLIVQTALQARPEDRYASAAALADDLRRHLAGQAIAARPERPLQTLARLVRRSPWTAGAAGLALALLVGWAGTLQFYAAELARQRDAATAQAERARRANELLLGVFRRADPLERDTVGGRDATVWASLDAATQDVRATLADDPATLAELLGTLARLYRVGGQSERAIELLDEALALHRRGPGPHGAAVAVVLGELGAVELQAGRAEAARAHLDEALALIDTLPADAALQAVPVLLDAGHAATDAGDARAAVRHFERALALLGADASPDPNALVESQFGLGNGLLQLGDVARAEAAIGESVRLTELHFGAEHPRIAGPLSALANVQRRLGHPQQAAATLRRAIDVMARAYGPGYAGVLSARNNLALALGAAGDARGEQRELQAVIDAKRARDGDDHPGLADHWQNLGASLAASGDADAALHALARARKLYDLHQGAGSPRPAFPRLTEAAVLLDRGDAGAAAAAAADAVAILARTLPAGHFARGVGGCLLGEAWIALGRADEGAALVRAALPVVAAASADQTRHAERCQRVAGTLAP